MAETISPAAGRRYGVARVCQVWGVPRSSFYAARGASDAGADGRAGPARAEAGDLRCRPARRHPGGPRALALVRRGPPQGLGAPARARRHPRSRASGCCG